MKFGDNSPNFFFELDKLTELSYTIIMNITSHTTTIKTIRPDHPVWSISDGMFISPRAGFEIDKKCPNTYSKIISECIANGWLRPIAHMTEKELIMAGLTQS